MSAASTLPRLSTAPFVRLAIANLDEVEREFVATVVATLCDDQMRGVRARLRRGQIALCIESDEVTFIDTDQVADQIAMNIAATALPRKTGRRS